MNNLLRITTQYIESEDRIRLVGETAPGQTVVLWLTQRLLGRLLPHLFALLESLGDDDVSREVVQEFAQQVATGELVPQAPVRVESQSHVGLVQSVDVAVLRRGVRLAFKRAVADEEAETIVLMLQPQLLRQWLSILFAQFQKAGWQLEVWPKWMIRAQARQQSAGSNPLH